MANHTMKLFSYFLIVIVLISLFFLFSVTEINFYEMYGSFLGMLFFMVILTAAQQLPVTLPSQAEVTVDFAIVLSIIVIFGSKVSILLVFLSTLFTELKRRKIMPLQKSVFNIALYIIMVGTAGFVYEITGGVPGQIDLNREIFRIVVLIFTYLLTNVGIVTIAVSLLENETTYFTFYNNFKWALPNYLALAPLGILLAVIYINIGISGVLLFLVPLLAARHSFQLYMNMRKVYLDTIQALATAIETKDPYTHGHSDRVAKYSLIIAEEMKLSGEFITQLHYAALLHDIGKIGIPEEILNKPKNLSEEEYEVVKQHPILGASIVEKLEFLAQPATFIKSHHERLNGTGYPQGLKEKEIPLGAAILAVADTFDALTSDRPYRKAWSAKAALEEIEKVSGVEFKSEVVEALKNALKKGSIKIDAC
ncbi:MAG TPA: HD domain-containing protein [Thermoanaerobacterales bacterium]|jgi:putative nucleotidyltransferase with HDIG domain|nr:HD domain-containing protein [Thermoanaerobacterales bacterium]